MSLQTFYRIVCDYCGRAHQATGQTPARVELAAHVDGWLHKADRGIVDVCPGCLEQQNRRAA